MKVELEAVTALIETRIQSYEQLAEKSETKESYHQIVVMLSILEELLAAVLSLKYAEVAGND